MKFPFFILLFSLTISLSLGQTSLQGIDLAYGPFSAGFMYYLATDSSRTYNRIYDWNNRQIPRPIPISLWYPSSEQPDSQEAMPVSAYMEILKEEEEWEYLPNAYILDWFYYPNTPINQQHLLERSHGYINLKPAAGKFPVIVYAPSYQASSIENFALCEYLASHGYIVISSPSRGIENRLMEGGSLKDIETQARDIEFLCREVGSMPYADYDRMATMGFSFGGLSHVLAQVRNKRIQAIVSLDGSIKYQYDKLKDSPFFEIEKVDVPFIHMSQKDIPEEVLLAENIDPLLNSEFEFYDSLLNSKAYQLKFHHLSHSYFSTLGVLFQARDTRQDKSDAEIEESYKWVCMYTLNFLDAHLKAKAQAGVFLENSPEANGIEASLISHKSKEPQARTYSFQDFNEYAAQHTYQHLDSLYQVCLRDYPSLKLPEGSLNNLGLQLTFNPQSTEQGIQVLRFATRLYSQSANLFDSLAEAYFFHGNREKAIENFEQSLALSPQNQHAIHRLKQLKAKEK